MAARGPPTAPHRIRTRPPAQGNKMAQDCFSMAGKVALVTGASSGLGRHFAKVLAEAGAHALVAARRLHRLETLVGEIESAGGRASALELDVTQPQSVAAAFAGADAAAGPLDVLINCAGIVKSGNFLDLEDADWEAVLEVNLHSLRRVSRQAARRMVDGGRGGAIINVASIAGLGAAPELSAYATSKAAVIQLTRVMATELWRHGVRVNALCPGFFRTEMNEAFFGSEQGQQYLRRIPPRRLGRPDELTGPLLLLASDASSFMTGVALPVDGGHSIRLI